MYEVILHRLRGAPQLIFSLNYCCLCLEPPCFTTRSLLTSSPCKCDTTNWDIQQQGIVTLKLGDTINHPTDVLVQRLQRPFALQIGHQNRNLCPGWGEKNSQLVKAMSFILHIRGSIQSLHVTCLSGSRLEVVSFEGYKG